MIENELKAYLATNVALISSRVYSVRLPQNVTFPALTFLKVSGARDHTLTGPSGIARPRFQVSCWSESYETAKLVSAQVRTALDGISVLMGTVLAGAVLLLGETDLVDPARNVYQIALDFEVIHRE